MLQKQLLEYFHGSHTCLFKPFDAQTCVVNADLQWRSDVGIYHLFTETEGNSVFCGPETAVVARGEAEGNNGGRGGTKHTSFLQVSVNKCFVI